MIFVAAICFLESLGFPTVLFFTLYLVAALGQVGVLLYLSHLLVYLMWSRGTDPDNAAIPYLTAVSSLVTQSTKWETLLFSISPCLLRGIILTY